MSKPYVVDPPRLKASSNLSIYQFIYELGRVAPIVYARDEDNAKLDVIPSYPDHLINASTGSPVNPGGAFRNTVTYQIVRREPGIVRADQAPFSREKEIKPRFRDYGPTDDGAISILGQWFDNLVQLDCWTTSNMEADELSEWLETFLFHYTGYFKELGVQEMYYWRGGRFTWGTTEEEAMTRWRNPFKVRSMVYYVRTERLWYINHSEIDEVRVTLEVD